MSKTICKTTGNPISECEFKEISRYRSEYEPSTENFSKECIKCGEVMFGTRKYNNEREVKAVAEALRKVNDQFGGMALSSYMCDVLAEAAIKAYKDS